MEFAKELCAGYDKTIRAVALSDLVTVHLKSRHRAAFGLLRRRERGLRQRRGHRLSLRRRPPVRSSTRSSTRSRSIPASCDGAKASCAAKIASAVDAGILGYHMYKNGQEFRAGDGLVTHGVEKPSATSARSRAEGMRETDREILHIMCD